MSQLVLGTAQFGDAYGATNRVGRIDDGEVRALLQLAERGGVTLFDTAADYGDAQRRLADLQPPEARPGYVSKFSLPEGEPTEARLFRDSLSVLRAESLYGLLFHKPADLADPRVGAAWAIVRAARDDGRIGRAGVSVYDLEELALAVSALPGLDILQIPASVVDRRLLDSAELRDLHESGVEIHVRSAYLQGLLLEDTARLDGLFAPLAPVVSHLREMAQELESSVPALLLGYLKRHPVVDAVLVGATSAIEFGETIGAWNEAPEESAEIPDPLIDPFLLDPRAWPRREAS